MKDEAKKLKIRTGGQNQTSPFIVRLSHPGQRIERDPVADLAASLIIDGDEEAAEAELVEAHDGGVSLAIAYDEFRDQLLEDTSEPEQERAVAFIPATIADSLQPTFLPALDPIVIEEIEVVEVFATEPQSFAERIAHVFSSKRALASFVLLALLLSAPLQAVQVFANVKSTAESVKGSGSAALDSFLRGATSLSGKDFAGASTDFSRAAADFAQAEDSLNTMHAVVTAAASVIPETEKTMSSVRNLTMVGSELATTAQILALAGNELSSKKSLTVVEKIDLLSMYIEGAEPHMDTAARAMGRIDVSALPPEYQGQITELKSTVPALASTLKEFVEFTDALTIILGGEGEVKYLAAFQNNTELRATGGFVGSFAELQVKDGAIENMRVPEGGSYALQGQLTEYVAAPGPLQLLRARWEFQDANWFPDFPTSARKMLWFEEHAGGPTMDGVIAVNASFIVDLLKVLGPVEMPEYGRTITADNFLLETQKIVELEYDKTENKPKAFIGDLAPVLLERVTNADFKTLLNVLSLVGDGLERKEIMVYFADNDIQASMEKLGFTGSLKHTAQDSLMVVNTNLGGGKTDGVISEEVNVEVNVGEDGSVTNTVTVARTHHGMKNELFRGANNVDYLRLYVPLGSELLTASGFSIPPDELFEISDVPLGVDEDLALHMKNVRKDEGSLSDIWEEQGHTVFGNWVQTSPGETSVATFTYRTPVSVPLTRSEKMFAANKPVPYTLFIQKQPGVEERRTAVRVNLPSSVEVVWNSKQANANVTAVTDNDRDAFFGWLLKP